MTLTLTSKVQELESSEEECRQPQPLLQQLPQLLPPPFQFSTDNSPSCQRSLRKRLKKWKWERPLIIQKFLRKPYQKGWLTRPLRKRCSLEKCSNRRMSFIREEKRNLRRIRGRREGGQMSQRMLMEVKQRKMRRKCRLQEWSLLPHR